MDICQIPTKGHVSCQSLAGQDWLPELLRHKIERDLPPVNQPTIIIIIFCLSISQWSSSSSPSLSSGGIREDIHRWPPQGPPWAPLVTAWWRWTVPLPSTLPCHQPNPSVSYQSSLRVPPIFPVINFCHSYFLTRSLSSAQTIHSLHPRLDNPSLVVPPINTLQLKSLSSLRFSPPRIYHELNESHLNEPSLDQWPLIIFLIVHNPHSCRP